MRLNCFSFFLGVMTTQAYAEQRQPRVHLLKKSLYDELLSKDGGALLAKTGSLLKGSSLRGKDNRKKFASIIQTFSQDDSDDQDGKSRFWTKRLFIDTLSALLNDYQLELPRIPGFSLHSWLKEQAGLLHDLAKRARRNSGYRPSSRSSCSSSMDQLQTLDYDTEERRCWRIRVYEYGFLQGCKIYTVIYG